MIKRNNLSISGNRTASKPVKLAVHEKLEQGEHSKPHKNREKIIRKSYALTKQDINHIQQIKDKCLNLRVVLNDSHIVRIALMLTSKLTETAIIKAATEVPKLIAGRPRGSE